MKQILYLIFLTITRHQISLADNLRQLTNNNKCCFKDSCVHVDNWLSGDTMKCRCAYDTYKNKYFWVDCEYTTTTEKPYCTKPTWTDTSTKPTWTDTSTKPTWTDKTEKPTWTDTSTKPTWTDKTEKPTWTDTCNCLTKCWIYDDYYNEDDWQYVDWKSSTCQCKKGYWKNCK
jgi:hypothetical protein